MAEWSIAAVLKTVVLRGTGGSNPSLSAKKQIEGSNLFEFFYLFFLLGGSRQRGDGYVNPSLSAKSRKNICFCGIFCFLCLSI